MLACAVWNACSRLLVGVWLPRSQENKSLREALDAARRRSEAAAAPGDGDDVVAALRREVADLRSQCGVLSLQADLAALQRRPRTAAEVIDDARSFDPEVAELVERNEATLASLHDELDDMRAELCVS